VSKKGIWVSPSEFVRFGESPKRLSEQIVTRQRSTDFAALGMYLPNPDPVLKSLGKDIKVYRDLRADAHVGGCIRRRKAAVRALKWRIGKEKSADNLTKDIAAIFDDLPVQEILTEMLDAVLYGYQPLEVMWEKVGQYLVPTAIVGKPPQWFVYDEDNHLRFRSRENSVRGEELPERKFLVARQDATYDNPYGFPDLSMVFWPTTFKRGGLRFWVQFTEKYGAPWIIGKHPRGTPDTETNRFLDLLEQMVQDAVAAIPDDSSVEIKEAAGKTGSAEVYERMLYFCRSEVSIALLGQNQTTESDANRASATAGLRVTEDIRDGDVALVCATFNELIRWICEMNFGSGPRPEFAMWQQEDVDTIQAERDEKLVKAGARFTNDYFRRAYGFQDGDLAEGTSPSADFAEDAGNADFTDQLAIDTALDALSADEMNREAQAMLAPLLERVREGMLPTDLMGVLAELYPEMDASLLQERLARILFVADVWGRLHA
jgi:phage gp29-like protein